MKNKPLVSVVMPVHNGEKYLREAIESILNQSYKNFEFIIVDDCSTDGSEGIIQKYRKKDKRIKFLRNKENKGAYFSYNRAINYSKGSLIAIMDSDDISERERLGEQVKTFLKDRNIVLVGSDLLIIDHKNEIVGQRVYPHTDAEIRRTIIFKNPFAHPSVMFKKDVYFTVGGYNLKYKNAMDYDLWFRFIKEGRVLNLPEFLVRYRIHFNQSKRKKLRTHLKTTISIQRKYLFQKEYFSLFALLNHLFLKILLLLPEKFVLWLFKKIEVKKANL